MRHIILSLALTLAFALAPAPASADIAPPDSCGAADSPCKTAPPDFQSPGVCKKQRCSRATPNGSVSYDCNRCQPLPKENGKDKPKK